MRRERKQWGEKNKEKVQNEEARITEPGGEWMEEAKHMRDECEQMQDENLGGTEKEDTMFFESEVKQILFYPILWYLLYITLES